MTESVQRVSRIGTTGFWLSIPPAVAMLIAAVTSPG